MNCGHGIVMIRESGGSSKRSSVSVISSTLSGTTNHALLFNLTTATLELGRCLDGCLCCEVAIAAVLVVGFFGEPRTLHTYPHITTLPLPIPTPRWRPHLPQTRCRTPWRRRRKGLERRVRRANSSSPTTASRTSSSATTSRSTPRTGSRANAAPHTRGSASASAAAPSSSAHVRLLVRRVGWGGAWALGAQPAPSDSAPT